MSAEQSQLFADPVVVIGSSIFDSTLVKPMVMAVTSRTEHLPIGALLVHGLDYDR